MQFKSDTGVWLAVTFENLGRCILKELQGAVKGTAYGLGSVTVAHHTWPLFRRQTLAFKGFLVSTFTIFGLVIGADTALLSHQAEHRLAEDRLRREAHIELARQGKIATEPEIAKWLTRRDAEMRVPDEEGASSSK